MARGLPRVWDECEAEEAEVVTSALSGAIVILTAVIADDKETVRQFGLASR